MRVIAGLLGGRTFESPKGHRTHPMSEKVRGAIFGALGDIQGLAVLDAYSGSGALSFEAVSRGASHSVAIDVDADAHVAMNKNIRSLGLTNSVKSIRANVSSWSDNNPSALFDLVLCDPPYDNLRTEPLIKLAQHVEIGGVVVYSLPPKIAVELSANGYQLVATKSYGDAKLVFYRRIS